MVASPSHLHPHQEGPDDVFMVNGEGVSVAAFPQHHDPLVMYLQAEVSGCRFAGTGSGQLLCLDNSSCALWTLLEEKREGGNGIL